VLLYRSTQTKRQTPCLWSYYLYSLSQPFCPVITHILAPARPHLPNLPQLPPSQRSGLSDLN